MQYIGTTPPVVWPEQGELERRRPPNRVVPWQRSRLPHVDLYKHTQNSVRLPIPELALGAVAEYFAITSTSSISDGFEAQMLYGEYRTATDPARQAALRTEFRNSWSASRAVRQVADGLRGQPFVSTDRSLS